MKKLLYYFKEFHKGYLSFKMYIICLLFIAALITVNYIFDIEDGYIDEYRGRILRYFLLGGYHAFGYLSVLFIVLVSQGKSVKLSSEFWIKIVLGFLIVGTDRGLYGYHDIIKSLTPYPAYRFTDKTVFYSMSFFTILIPLSLILWAYDKNRNEGLYGLKFTSVDFRPYFILLLIMIPLVFAASFGEGFIDYYPTYKRAGGAIFATYYGINEWICKIIYETSYISSFIYTELFFRGFLVIGLTRILGKNAILPMAATYAVVHFGKPPLEAVSSVFGGYLLGIIAFYSRNIWGGVFVHSGIALCMEIFAFIRTS
ncbi:MAG: CPBP family intramembrane metalloprotease [Bacteroidales bacterium]|nr:CPBP family intramembrane metalloprotease [Bacteroidales bacterium]